MNNKRKVVLRKFRALPLRDKWLFITAIVLGHIIKKALKKYSYNTVVAFLKKHVPQVNRNDITNDELNRYQYLIILTNKCRPGFKINCLDISLAYWFLLKRKGLKTNMQFGVKKLDGEFKSHAWLEFEGRLLTLDDNVTEKYTPLPKPML